MTLYSLSGSKIKVLNENNSKFKVEKDIQNLIESNLSVFFPELILIKSEYIIKNLRMDTLAFDYHHNSFVIIEYKYDKNQSLTDQGLSYLSLLLENKHEVLLKLNKILGKNLDVDEIDWKDTRTFFISRKFTAYQSNTARLGIVPIHCFTFKTYGDIVELNELEKSDEKVSASTIKEINKKARGGWKVKKSTEKQVIKDLELTNQQIDAWNEIKNGLTSNLKFRISRYSFFIYEGREKFAEFAGMSDVDENSGKETSVIIFDSMYEDFSDILRELKLKSYNDENLRDCFIIKNKSDGTKIAKAIKQYFS